MPNICNNICVPSEISTGSLIQISKQKRCHNMSFKVFLRIGSESEFCHLLSKFPHGRICKKKSTGRVFATCAPAAALAQPTILLLPVALLPTRQFVLQSGARVLKRFGEVRSHPPPPPPCPAWHHIARQLTIDLREEWWWSQEGHVNRRE